MKIRLRIKMFWIFKDEVPSLKRKLRHAVRLLHLIHNRRYFQLSVNSVKYSKLITMLDKYVPIVNKMSYFVVGYGDLNFHAHIHVSTEIIQISPQIHVLSTTEAIIKLFEENYIMFLI